MRSRNRQFVSTATKQMVFVRWRLLFNMACRLTNCGDTIPSRTENPQAQSGK
jgi:hypothetical protein